MSEYAQFIITAKQEREQSLRDAVYDAAMALVNCGVELSFITPTIKEEPWHLLQQFYDACRRAKEGR